MVSIIKKPEFIIKAIHVEELKGIQNCTINFDSPITAIMGVNGIGKSTIIHALSCCFRAVSEYGEERKFPTFFPPTTNATWKNSHFWLELHYYRDGKYLETSEIHYSKSFDRWAPRYDRQPRKDVRYFGVSTCIPDIEAFNKERLKFVTTDKTDRESRKIIEKASYILNKDYTCLTNNKSDKKSYFGVKTARDISYSSLSMGAGEQRVIRIISALQQAPAYSLILIDEIDLLLHSEALKRLVEVIYRYTDERHLQVIFTTHSLVMKDLSDFVDIKYLDKQNDHVDIYEGLTSLAWKELSGEAIKPINVYVEDFLSAQIVKQIATNLGIKRKVKVIEYGSSTNAFTLATAFVITEENVDNVMILLDGDVYRSVSDKQKRLNKAFSGNEENAELKREEALSLIYQYDLPQNQKPEEFLHRILCEMPENGNEIVSAAKKIHAVKDSHDWIGKIAQDIDDSSETIYKTIVETCSLSPKWEKYTFPVRKWLEDRKKL